MPIYYQTTVPEHLNGFFQSGAIQVAKGKFARRANFKPLPSGNQGIAAEINAPFAGAINSIAVYLDNAAPSGELYVSTVDPNVDYVGFFLYAVLNPIVPTTNAPKMYRRAEIVGGGYTTVTTQTSGRLYLLILGGPSASAEGLTASVSLVVHTGDN